jgi:GlpG protein
MRLIYTLDDKKLGHQFSIFLKKKGIENLFEIVSNTDWGSPEYGTYNCHIWIIEEENVDKAQEWLALFKQNPNNPIFYTQTTKVLPFLDSLSLQPKEQLKSLPEANKVQSTNSKKFGKVTLCVLFTCIFLFFYGEITAPPHYYAIAGLPATPLNSSPIDKLLFYDYPQAYDIIDKLVKVYGKEKLQNVETLSPEGLLLLKKYSQTPIWKGLYPKLVNYFIHPAALYPIFDAPLFEKIRQGEGWRLFTPCLLHAGFFHIFFNMMWVVVLGKLIEIHIGASRYIFLIFVTAVFSNTAQYLMSGSNFVGYSGVICGMLAFVWSRQKKAPWENYKLAPGIISFMFFFVLAMFGLEIASFLFKIYKGIDYFPSIANTAHLIGGFAGFFLGRFNFMSMRN